MRLSTLENQQGDLAACCASLGSSASSQAAALETRLQAVERDDSANEAAAHLQAQVTTLQGQLSDAVHSEGAKTAGLESRVQAMETGQSTREDGNTDLHAQVTLVAAPYPTADRLSSDVASESEIWCIKVSLYGKPPCVVVSQLSDTARDLL